MKNSIVLVLLIIGQFCLGQTQSDMNQKANDDFKKADKELNTVYQQVLKTYKQDAKFTAKLKAAQNAWIKFRDAEMNALFPAQDKQLQYGSIFPMCWSLALKDLTTERTKKLKVWLDGIEEGDACSGSVRNK